MDITFLIVENGLQNCFVFQPVIKYFKPPATANNSFHQ